jgi:Tfp pilus assembly protein PilO
MAMNLSLSKMPWYGQLGAFLALSLAMAGVFWNFYASPAQASINARREQLATINAEIDKGQAAARRLPEFRRQVGELQAQLERLRAVLPEEKDVADLLRRVQGMAT